jgi:IclR family acetate operon transcriptional repressor
MSNSARMPTLIQSLQRGLKLVEAVTENGPLTAKSSSEITGLAFPTAYRLLRTLIDEDYLRRLPDGRYALGPQLISVTQLEGRARSFRLVRDLMCELAAESRAHVVIGAVNDADIVVWSAVENPCTPPINCWPGTRLPAHATAVGKSILSRMPPLVRAEHVRRHPLQAWTSQTAVVAKRLESDLAEGGIARSEQEYIYGVSCAAVGLDGMQDLAAVGMAYSSTRSTHARVRAEELLVRAADAISSALEAANTVNHPEGCREAV